ncbi:VanW family protein [Brevibacterium daeguense]|uniref:VanW family protein n=1 Tax=Brevibacterium daeguense TaxID=909936 RepID=A0ABP8EJF2_9MICO|nr:VanW family protein [Brevibacterium daeguense]
MADRSAAASHRHRTIALVTIGVVLVLGILYVLTAVLTARALPAEASAAGVDIGGMSEEDAVAKLDAELRPRASEVIVLSAKREQAELEPADVGLTVDTQATVARAVDFSLDPRVVWDRLFGTHEYAPVIAIDEEKFGPVVDRLAEDFSLPPEDAALTFEGADSVVTEGIPGTVVEQDAIRQTIRDHWLRSDNPLAVEVAETEPDITTEEARAAQTEIADPAVSEDIVVEAAEETEEGKPTGESSELTITPEIIAGSLTFEPRDGELKPVFDAKKLKSATLDANPEVGSEAKDASYRIVDGTPEVVPAESGVSVDSEELAEAVLPALTAEERTATVALVEAEPEFTTEEAEAADVDEVISDFSTAYSSEPNRDTNLRVASERVSGTVLLPGEEFSLNETIGRRTAANGYRPAGVINEGQMTEDYGGGVSQVSTTLFNAAYFAGFELNEHQAHSRYISRYPEGREATLDWQSIDMRFTNSTDTPVVLDMYLAGGEVHARVFGERTVDVESSSSERFAFTSPSTIRESGPRCSPQSPREGWSITIFRTIKDHDTGEVIDRDQFTTVYRPVNRVVCS